MSAVTEGSRISESVAQQLIGTYKAEEGWTPDKTRAVWFSSADIADIASLINESGGDGIRIYFGKYPATTDIPGTPDPAYKGKVTLVFIPTVAGEGGSHQDLFPPVAGPGAAAADGGQGYNHGSLCPPNCSTTPTSGS